MVMRRVLATPTAPAAQTSPGSDVAGQAGRPGPSLARTGSSTGELVVIGALLLAVGAGLAIFGRRRPRRA